jgi:phospholipase C
MRPRSPAFAAQNLAWLVVTCALTAGCGTSSSTAAVDDGAPSDGAGDDATTLGDDGFSEPENDGLDLDGGALPLPSADAGTPIPTKIRYVLVLIKENHTFDNYFTGFPGAESAATATLSTGATLTRPTAPTGALSKDICHSNACGQRAYAGGKMNGFDLNGAGQLPFVRYTEAEIPNYWQYARNFVLADHFFSTTLGPSTPGHAVFWTGRSLSLDNASCNNPDGGTCAGFGCKADKNTTITAYDPDTCATKQTAPCFDVPSLTDHLPKDFTWTDYGGPLALMVKSVAADPGYAAHFRKQADLVTDLAAGKLANLTIAHLWSTDVSEHPAASPCTGENFTVDIVNAAMKLPQWNEMAIVVTWDDWGGFYDHVAPTVHKCSNGQIFQQGFRLPALVISPYAKKGVVLHTPTEQASVPRLVEELWGMPYMTARDPHARDGTAGSLLGAFDFTQAARAPMPLTKHACP